MPLPDLVGRLRKDQGARRFLTDEAAERIVELERMLKDYQDAWPELRQAFMEIRAKARFEQAQPTGLHMTCLSIIEKIADKALNGVPDHRL